MINFKVFFNWTVQKCAFYECIDPTLKFSCENVKKCRFCRMSTCFPVGMGMNQDQVNNGDEVNVKIVNLIHSIR